MSTTKQRVHPLFDERSEYRMATRFSVWRDQGVSTVVEYFQDRARDARRARDATDGHWGLGPDVDASMSEFLREAALASAEAAHEKPAIEVPKKRVKPQRSVTADVPTVGALGVADPTAEGPTLRAHGATILLTPTLLGLDCGAPDVLPPLPLLRWPQDTRSMFWSTADESQWQSDFQFSIEGLPAGRPWVAFFLEHHLVETLAGFLDAAPEYYDAPNSHRSPRELPRRALETTSESRSEVVRDCLSMQVLCPASAGGGAVERWQRTRASRISLLFSLMPTLIGTSSPEGVGTIGSFPLHMLCPGIDATTLVTVCTRL